MKKYDVYGMGNALLDIEFAVTEETLQHVKADKGVMTLIDAAREHYLLEELSGIKQQRACGGSAGNTITLLSALGGKTFFSCRVANDEAGDYYLHELAQKGVQTNLDHTPRPAGITGKCIAMVTPDAERTMNTYLGITESFSTAELNQEAIAQSKYLYIEGYLTAQASAQQATLIAAACAKQHNVKIALTLSDPNMTTYFRPQLLEITEHGVDLLFCNTEEAFIFTGQSNLADAATALKQYAKQFIITRGKLGALVFDGTQLHEVAAYQVTAVDTTGAGDMFAGACLYAVTQAVDLCVAADIANLAAAKVVTNFGPRLQADDIANIKQHLAQHAGV